MIRTITPEMAQTFSTPTLERQFRKALNGLMHTKLEKVEQAQLDFYHVIRDELITRNVYNPYIDNLFWSHKRTVERRWVGMLNQTKTFFF